MGLPPRATCQGTHLNDAQGNVWLRCHPVPPSDLENHHNHDHQRSCQQAPHPKCSNHSTRTDLYARGADHVGWLAAPHDIRTRSRDLPGTSVPGCPRGLVTLPPPLVKFLCTAPFIFYSFIYFMHWTPLPDNLHLFLFLH